MNLGATKKREMYILGGLLLVGGYLFYSNVLSGPSSPEPSRPSRAAAPGVAKTSKKGPVFTDRASDAETPTSNRRSAGSVRTSEEFRPSMKHRPEEHLDPMSIDPTLHKELLAKVQAVTIEGGRRNLFSIGTPPLPPEPVVAVKGPTQTAKMIGPEPPPPPPPKPAEPPPPPINLKYYGYSSARGDNRKHAFFLDGDDILVAAEGETVKKRYRVVRIGVNSVVMEDTQFKHEQTLPLQEEIAG